VLIPPSHSPAITDAQTQTPMERPATRKSLEEREEAFLVEADRRRTRRK